MVAPAAFFCCLSGECALGRKTPLYQTHVDAGARMVDFGGWDMPVHYGSQIEEHHAVRREAGVFDVSHMGVVDVRGPAAREAMQRLLCNDVGRLETLGDALYTCMLNERGGVIDDLIVYAAEDGYRVVVNAATREQDLAWMRSQGVVGDVTFEERDDLAMLAVQGPGARSQVQALLDEAVVARAGELRPFQATRRDELFISRTGYTGEDGFELVMPAGEVADWWQRLVAAGVRPCGLGARDTLRLEAGLNLYGTDMTTETTPLESALGWTVAWEPSDRDFIGRQALAAQREQGVTQKLSGVLLEDRGVLRNHQGVRTPAGEGEITSGSWSPTLERAIGFARVPADAGDECEIDMRGKWKAARLVRPPFVRHGRIRIDLD